MDDDRFPLAVLPDVVDQGLEVGAGHLGKISAARCDCISWTGGRSSSMRGVMIPDPASLDGSILRDFGSKGSSPLSALIAGTLACVDLGFQRRR